MRYVEYPVKQDSRFSKSKKEKRSIYKIPVNTKVFTGTFPVPLKAFIPASVSFFLLYFGPNHHSAPFYQESINVVFRNDLWLCIFVGHLNKNGA